MDKEVKKLVKELKQQGWRVEERRSSRLMAYSPDGVTMVPIHKTPGDRKSLKNLMGQLRRGGYKPGG